MRSSRRRSRGPPRRGVLVHRELTSSGSCSSRSRSRSRTCREHAPGSSSFGERVLRDPGRTSGFPNARGRAQVRLRRSSPHVRAALRTVRRSTSRSVRVAIAVPAAARVVALGNLMTVVEVLDPIADALVVARLRGSPGRVRRQPAPELVARENVRPGRRGSVLQHFDTAVRPRTLDAPACGLVVACSSARSARRRHVRVGVSEFGHRAQRIGNEQFVEEPTSMAGLMFVRPHAAWMPVPAVTAKAPSMRLTTPKSSASGRARSR